MPKPDSDPHGLSVGPENLEKIEDPNYILNSDEKTSGHKDEMH